MRIEELIIDGFKSYPVRTQITGWDTSFNAITGLNGSGKSNILDAICFVLGIQNMAQMRAANQQDLIYKRGQAGITKASVTIVFDNSEADKSPEGYKDCKQITVTRQVALPAVSKYLVNGHKATQVQIQNLFQSVQLNINNPNFVIMQGRITKVLNMRPAEILGMVEEAAGTRMFEDRKDKAIKTMAKKDKKVQEIKSILDEEVTPQLNKLREQKRSYLAYMKSLAEFEKLGKRMKAYEWMASMKRAEERLAALEAKEAELEQLREEGKKAVKDCERAEKEIAVVKKKRDAEMAKGGKLKKLQDEAGEFGKHAAKLRTQAEIKAKSMKEEEGRVKNLDAQIKESEATLVSRQKDVEKTAASYDKVKEEHTQMEGKLNANEELLQTLLTGLSSSNAKNKGGGYMGQLADARAQIAQGQAEEEQAKVKLNMSKKDLAGLETKMKAFAKDAGDNMKKLKAVQDAVSAMEEKSKKTGWSKEQDVQLEKNLRGAREEVKMMAEQRDRVKQRIGRLNFDYEDPYPNFDRRRVKGVAAQLVSLPEEHFNKATALEIAGGGKLFNVVIEDEKIGKDLIKSGRLRKRVTFIPLTKISAYTLAASKLKAAQQIAGNKVRTALSLVGYEDDVAKAVAYIFSDTLICDDADTAKRVTFDKAVLTKSVTFEGDVYDPSGTLSGGAPPNSSKVLIQVQELLGYESKVREAQDLLDGFLKEEERTRNARAAWKALDRDLDMKRHELKLLQEQVEGSNASLMQSEVDKVKNIIQDLQKAIADAQEKQKAMKDEVKKLEQDMEEFKNNKEGKIDELKANISKQKAALQKNAVIVKTQQKELQTAKLELEQTEGDIAGEKESLQEARAGITRMFQELDQLKDLVTQADADYQAADERLQEELATLSRFDTELKELERVIKEKKALSADIEIKIGQQEHEIQQLEKNRVGALNDMARLEQLNEWIKEEKAQFGKEGGQYDFTNFDHGSVKAKMEELQKDQKGMKKKLNNKVMNMIEGVEKKEADCQKNMAIVEVDKGKIEETIAELDRYKRDALMKTWTKVNADFGGIFAELLPGNFAKLQPPDGQDLMDGLEVKVQLGTVWKQSLTELSGGQRSLIALSLIMALLQFKPAPMYILDEIDAALDLSHTQHIGQLFRTRFKGSQFIVVSLKEGLFTNANVLFRARFRDGTSIVERTAQRSTSSLYEEEDDRNPRRRRAAN